MCNGIFECDDINTIIYIIIECTHQYYHICMIYDDYDINNINIMNRISYTNNNNSNKNNNNSTIMINVMNNTTINSNNNSSSSSSSSSNNT